MTTVVRFDPVTQRVFVFDQRIHHGPPGIGLALAVLVDRRLPSLERLALASLLAAWGLSDLKDWRNWFRREPYVLPRLNIRIPS